MKNPLLLLLFFFFLSGVSLNAQNSVETKAALLDVAYVVPQKMDLHLTDAANPLVNSTVNLSSESSWLYFDNIKPTQILDKYQSQILINGQPLNPEVNARVSIYVHGTVVVPHAPSYQPLEVFTGQNFTGKSTKYNMYTFHKKLGTFDNAIRSFKLKKGYMATLANDSTGKSFSRVFIADKEDLIIPVMQSELDLKVSFIRVFRWEWVSKKGWCGSTDGANLLDCTWFYTWSADKSSDYNHEFVPIRQTEWWPGWEEINGLERVSHLLGYNEPDHSEQANMMVDVAVNQWPNLLSSGLRVGSPATTDFNWLYRFMDQCKALNYRVDYVVIHCYWNSMSPEQWYKALKAVYDKTGRPLWIKEWNNGANWTNEWWPEDKAEAQAKARNELKGILQVMDTAHFVERYSIYNWVEDKRAMLLPNPVTGVEDVLTPAGELYRDNKSAVAFDRKNEVLPIWKMLPVSLDYTYETNTKDVKLTWNNPNRELSKAVIIKRKIGKGTYEEIACVTDHSQLTFIDRLDENMSGRVSYQISVLGLDEVEVSSKVVEVYCVPGTSTIICDNAVLSSATWTPFLFKKPYAQAPMVILGTPSFLYKSPMTYQLKGVTEKMFSFRYAPWEYLTNTLVRDEFISYLTLPVGNYQWGGVKVQVAVQKNVSKIWSKVIFSIPFDVVPAVFTTLVTVKSGYPQAVRIRNVTTTGFEVCLQKEEGNTQPAFREDINYIALTPGVGEVNGKKLIVGISPEDAAGNTADAYTIDFGTMVSRPALFSSMQTTSDEITSTLRYKELTETFATVFKQREASKTTTTVAKEQVAWMVMELGNGTGINEQKVENRQLTIYPNPASNVIHLGGIDGDARVEIYNLLGQLLLKAFSAGKIDIQTLPSGYYQLVVDGKRTALLMKK